MDIEIIKSLRKESNDDVQIPINSIHEESILSLGLPYTKILETIIIKKIPEFMLAKITDKRKRELIKIKITSSGGLGDKLEEMMRYLFTKNLIGFMSYVFLK